MSFIFNFLILIVILWLVAWILHSLICGYVCSKASFASFKDIKKLIKAKELYIEESFFVYTKYVNCFGTRNWYIIFDPFTFLWFIIIGNKKIENQNNDKDLPPWKR